MVKINKIKHEITIHIKILIKYLSINKKFKFLAWENKCGDNHPNNSLF